MANDHAVHVDTHQRSDLEILGDCPHRRAGLRAHDVGVEAGHQQHRGDDDHRLRAQDAGPQKRPFPLEDVPLRVGLEAGAEEAAEGVLQEERGPDGRDQRDQARRTAERPVSHTLNKQGNRHRGNRGQGENRSQGEQRTAVQEARAAERGCQVVRGVRAGHEYITVGEVDHAQDAVDHRVA